MSRARHLLLASSALLPLLAVSASAGPEGPNVVAGSATVHNAGSANVVINQGSQRAVINWHMFNIGAGETTTFNTPGSSAVTLNRVTGGMGPSQILGTLNSNGQVFVVNRDGFVFGAGAVINTAGFLATTHDIKNEDFMAGRYDFNIPGRPDASIVNLGTITAHSGGFAALVAPGVRNAGTITATLGSVSLAASGSGFTLDLYGDKLITLGVNDQVANQVIDVATGQPLSSLVTNTGKLSANGGRVELTAAAARRVVDSVINTSGVVEANTIGAKGGRIVLGAATGASKPAGAPKQTVRVSGKLSAAGRKQGEKGGKVVVTGETIEVAGATLDASGKAGGGKVLIGGDWGAGQATVPVTNPSAHLESSAIPTASTVSIDAATTIDASATDSGNGGKVILWSDERTSFAGRILALGGPNLGSGGFVEVSSHGLLQYGGTVDLRAANGSSGTLLLDPFDILIQNGPPDGSTGGSFSAGGEWGAGATSVITTADLLHQLGLGNVVITTSGSGTDAGDITIASGFSWSGNNSLVLSAHNDIVFNGGVTLTHSGGGGNLTLRADSDGSGAGKVVFSTGSGVNFASSGGHVSIYYNPSTPTLFSGHKYENGIDYAQFVSVGSPDRLKAYMLVNNQSDLGNISVNLGGTYALGKSFSGSGSFLPIGLLGGPFTGIFDGQGETISNLTISASGSTDDKIGLFAEIGANGTVRNLALENITVDANPAAFGAQYLGILAGKNSGTIDTVSVSGGVSPGVTNNATVGGLVGDNGGTITHSNSTATVSGNLTVGGLVGYNRGSGTVASSWSSGTVTGTDATWVGGLVGETAFGSSITDSYSHSTVNASVTGANPLFAGGLVGLHRGSIAHSHATGNVTTTDGDVRAGGLVGASFSGASIVDSHAEGHVTANTSSLAHVGGLAGQNAGTITNSWAAAGNVSSTSGFAFTGGLVGWNESTGIIDASHAMGAVSGNGDGIGGLVGLNDNSIINSYATGWVSTTTAGWVGGLVGRNNATGAITDSNATGNVSVSSTGSPDFFAGGLVGINLGTIGTSHATGTVTGNGGDAYLGGLVGGNETGASITGSWATGAVSLTSTTIGYAGGLAGGNEGTITDSNATGTVQLLSSAGGYAGGLVGYSVGSVTDSHATGAVGGSGGLTAWLGGLVGYVDTGANVDNSYASGAVSYTTTGLAVIGGLVGESLGAITDSNATGHVALTNTAAGVAGGLVGRNEGTINDSQALGNVGGDAFAIGGLVGWNEGMLTTTHASGAVSGSSVTMGGLVGINLDTIYNSHATGNVNSTGGSSAGGFVGLNNSGSIESSYATGNVSITNGIAGGFAAFNTASIETSRASGAVSGDAGSMLGGFVGFNYEGAIQQSYSTSSVTGGFASGGFAGVNVGNIDRSYATGAVTVGDAAYAGGFVALNYRDAGLAYGTISRSYATGAITAGISGIVGGFAAQNSGVIDETYAAGLVTGGSGSTTGGLVAVDGYGIPGGFTPPTTPASTPGTVTNSYWDTETTGQSTSAGGAGLTTAQLTSALPPGFSVPVWSINAGSSYPFLDGLSTPVPTPDSPAPPPVPPPPPPPPHGHDDAGCGHGQDACVPPTQLAALVQADDPTPDQPQDVISIVNDTPPSAPPPSGDNPQRPRRVSGVPPRGETRFVDNEVVLQLGGNVTPEQIAAIAREIGLEVIATENVGLLARTVYRFRITSGKSVADVIRALEAKNVTAFAQPNYVYTLAQQASAQEATSGQETASISHTHGDSEQYVIPKLRLPETHAIARGNDVLIAVIDSAVDPNHPDLQGAIAERLNTVEGEVKPHSHGTGMAGAIASQRRLLGVAPRSKLLTISAFGPKAQSAESTSMQIVKGLDWAVQKGAKVINMSFAGPRDPMLQQAIRTMYQRGIVMVAAAGNAGPSSPPLFPAADPHVIAVTATDIQDRVFQRANRGKYIDVAAPGVDVLVPAPEASYQLTTGTSVAAAHVSGVAALLLERNPNLKPPEIRKLLMSTARKGTLARPEEIGSGLVDPYQALQRSGRAAAAN